MSTSTRTADDELTLSAIQTSPEAPSSPAPAPAATSHHRRASSPPEPETSPWNLIMVGFCLGVAGGLGVALGSSVVFFLGFVAIGIAAALSVIGVIAEGIRYGARWVAYDQGSSS